VRNASEEMEPPERIPRLVHPFDEAIAQPVPLRQQGRLLDPIPHFAGIGFEVVEFVLVEEVSNQIETPVETAAYRLEAVVGQSFR
tara:strand:+ start:45 stop:299 length:255 start_codon:yes stop_codon:yes gene_type:complete